MPREILIGGSGKQAAAVHLPVLLDRPDSRLVTIADPVDPRRSPFSSKHSQGLDRVGTQWLPLSGQTNEDLDRLTQQNSENPADTLIISCPPLHHAEYVAWGLGQGMDVIVDKPFISIPNQFGDPEAPAKLQEEYARLKELRDSSQHVTYDRKSKVSVPVMRRFTPPYTTILENITDVYVATGQPLTNIQTTRSDGCFRFPDEFDRPGAHGYRDGLGSLTQSGYHYLDFMAASVAAAPPEGLELSAEMTSQTRVSDARHASQDTPFSRFLERTNTPPEEGDFQGDNAELDFSVNYKLRQAATAPADLDLQLTFIQQGSASRRVSPSYPPEATHDEGLTNDCVTVIHQGPLQSFHLLVAQDGVNGGRTTLVRRVNPKLADMLDVEPLTITDYPLQPTANIERNKAMVGEILDDFAGKGETTPLLDAERQDLTMELYTAAIGASVGPYSRSLNSNLWRPSRYA